MKRLGGWLILGGLIGAGIVGMLAFQEGKIAKLGTAEPEEITVDALGKRGLSGNVHLKVTQPIPSNVWVTEKKGNTVNVIWLPIKGTDGQVKLILKSYKLKGEGDILAMVAQGQVTGIITNEIHSLGSSQRKLLEEKFPGTDFNTMPILEQEKSFPTSNKVTMMYGGAGALGLLAVLGVVLLLIARKQEG